MGPNGLEYTLYVGGDESNHGDRSRAEIDVATFSRLEEDSILRKFPNRRDYDKLDIWLNRSDRTYLFAFLSSEAHRSHGLNLPVSIPDLLTLFLAKLTTPPTSIQIFLDGQIPQRRLKSMAEVISRFYSGEVEISTYTKKRKNAKGNMRKGPTCPAVVYYADVLAARLNDSTAGNLFQHPNFAFIR